MDVTVKNVSSLIDMLSDKIHAPASAVWEMALRHNYAIAYTDGINLILQVLFIALLVSVIVFNEKQKTEEPVAVTNSMHVICCFFIMVLLVAFYFNCMDLIPRLVSPQYMTAQDILNTIRN